MKTTDLALIFENEWITKYPFLRYFIVDTAVLDILYFKGISASSIPPEERLHLVSFLTKYLKEHKDRFHYNGNNEFYVVKTMSKAEQLRMRGSPN